MISTDQRMSIPEPGPSRSGCAVDDAQRDQPIDHELLELVQLIPKALPSAVKIHLVVERRADR